MSFKYTSRHHGWYAAQVPHGTTYVVLTLSLLIRPVWPSTYDELVSLSQKKKETVHCSGPNVYVRTAKWLLVGGLLHMPCAGTYTKSESFC